MKEIIRNEMILARHITEADIKEGLNFFSEEHEFIQTGVWRYQRDTKLKAHVHNLVKRTVNRTYEVLYIIRGQIQASIYDLENNLVDTLVAYQGEILILLECGHGYTILEDDTTVLEVKNGPYLGADIDRHRIDE